MVQRQDTWSLTQAARVLNQPQHRLIYLCDQGVVRPDFEDARGRGSSRLFSARNILEFAVALELRALQIPASALVAVVYVLRAFERIVQDDDDDAEFALPRSLLEAGAPDLRIVVGDGRFLYVSIASALDDAPKVFGGIDLQSFRVDAPDLENLERGSQLMKPLATDRAADPDHAADPGSSAFGGPEGSRHWRVEISLTRIAQDLHPRP